MIYTHLAAAAVAGAVAFGGAWKLQSLRFDAKEKDHVEIHAAEQLRAFKSFERDQDKVITAQRAQTQRVAGLVSSAAGSRNELGRLRDATATALRAAEESHATSLVTATTASRLLNSCAGEYQALGERADRHVSDFKALIEATQ